MPIINSAGFERLVGEYRLLWVRGRYGSGKTAISFKLAEYFLRRGYRLITNTPSVWSDGEVRLNENGLLHSVVIMDEAGLELKLKGQLETMAAYARKMDCVYIFPSFFPPTRWAQVVTLQPLFGFSQIGIPLSVYEWRVNLGGFKDRGWFLWSWPSEVWGIFSSRAPQTSVQSLIYYLDERVKEFKAREGVTDNAGLRGFDTVPEVDAGASAFASFGDNVEALAEAADELAAISFRPVRRKRF
ncbi:MAG: hypothetical protein H7835_19025 [Magnetococcus sp. XQGC-1]